MELSSTGSRTSTAGFCVTAGVLVRLAGIARLRLTAGFRFVVVLVVRVFFCFRYRFICFFPIDRRPLRRLQNQLVLNVLVRDDSRQPATCRRQHATCRVVRSLGQSHPDRDVKWASLGRATVCERQF